MMGRADKGIMITTAVGNFPKVAESGIGTSVMKAINSWQKQELSDSGLEDVFQTATRGVIQEQEKAGDIFIHQR